MQAKVNIVALVDVIAALSQGTLEGGNLCLVDDGQSESAGQGTTGLCTVVTPGQVVSWTALAVDVQTPLVIKGITFLGPAGAYPPGPAVAPAPPADPGSAGAGAGFGGGPGAAAAADLDPDQRVWSAVVPATMLPKVPYRYRLELQMDQGSNSVLYVDSPALMCS